jgi:hypothetical protein
VQHHPKRGAGIGKTCLANEFLGWAAANGVDVIQEQAFETSSQLTYQAVGDALRARIEQENAPDNLLSDTWQTELACHARASSLTDRTFHLNLAA